MIIDVRGKNDDETYRNAVLTMASLGFKPIRVVCEKCGDDAYCFREELIDADGYSKYACTCGGQMKTEK